MLSYRNVTISDRKTNLSPKAHSTQIHLDIFLSCHYVTLCCVVLYCTCVVLCGMVLSFVLCCVAMYCVVFCYVMLCRVMFNYFAYPTVRQTRAPRHFLSSSSSESNMLKMPPVPQVDPSPSLGTHTLEY